MDAIPVTDMADTVIPIHDLDTGDIITRTPLIAQEAFITVVLPSGSEFTPVIEATVVDTTADIVADTAVDTVVIADTTIIATKI